jgi:hypothetical protein
MIAETVTGSAGSSLGLQDLGEAYLSAASPAETWLTWPGMKQEQALTAVVIALSLATLVSVATAFCLYRWRRLILEKPYLLSPEHLATQVLSPERRIA